MIVRRQTTKRMRAHSPHILLHVHMCHHLVLCMALRGMLQRVRATYDRWTKVPENKI